MIDIVNGLRRIAEEGYRFAGDAADEIERLRASLKAAEKERDDVAQQLVQSEIGKREISEARDGLQAEVGKLKDLEVSRCVKINGYIVDNARLAEEVVRLQAKIAKMEQQVPVAEWIENRFHQYPQLVWNKKYRVTIGDKLYTRPAPAQSVPERITHDQAPHVYSQEAAEGYADGWNACVKKIVAAAPQNCIKAAMEAQREGCAEIVLQAAHKAADCNNLRDYELLRALSIEVAKAPEVKP